MIELDQDSTTIANREVHGAVRCLQDACERAGASLVINIEHGGEIYTVTRIHIEDACDDDEPGDQDADRQLMMCESMRLLSAGYHKVRRLKTMHTREVSN